MSSNNGKYPFHPIGIYSMTKAALDNMVQFLAKELMGDGIRVNAVAPGLIKTEFARDLWEGPIFPESLGEAS